MKLSKNQWIGVVVALAVAGFMFYGISYLYSKLGGNNLVNKNQIMADVQIETVSEGTGQDMVEMGDTVKVAYIGMFEDGQEFDRAHEPFEVTLGVDPIIKGWEKGILGMKVGEERRLIIPPSLGYGDTDYGPIPANSTLIFEIKMLSIKKGAPKK